MKTAGRWILYVLGVLVGFFCLWALFETFHNPTVPLAAPRVISKPLRNAEVTVVLGGDFAPTDGALPFIRRRGYRYPYLRTAHILRRADVSFLNLESPVTRHPHRYALYKTYSYRVEPEAVEAWQWMGLDIVGLANNHIKDRRNQGLIDTVRHLDRTSIAHVGAGRNESAARRPVIFDVGGTRVGFLAYLEDWAFYNLYLRTFARGEKPGCARFVYKDVAEDIRRLRPKVDVLVVSVHWGRTYAGVTRDQETMARFLARQGVDVVAGHGPHIVLPVEVRGRTVIFYSLGNYAWGAWGRTDFRIGLLARLRITPRVRTTPGRVRVVEILPILTQNRRVLFQPRRILPHESRLLGKFLTQSRKRGTKLQVVGSTVRVLRP